MCGRYIFANDENEFILRLIRKAEASMKPEQFEKLSLFDVYPSQNALVMTWNPSGSTMHISSMKWGYEGRNGQLVINARSETAFSSSFFAGSVPCAVPASSYYEWTETRQKYIFRIDEPFFLAGLCRREQDGYHFVILTEEAAFPQNEIHDRQPVLLTLQNAKTWTASQQPTQLLHLSVPNRIIEKA